eukprot:gene15326-18158_t
MKLSLTSLLEQIEQDCNKYVHFGRVTASEEVISKISRNSASVTNSIPSSEYADHQSDLLPDDNRPHIGLQLLGNSGVGKSFLVNILLGKPNHFKHELAATSVTTTTDMCKMTIGSLVVEVFNIPGLVENDQDKISRNKQQIDNAFSMQPYCVVCFVFGSNGGRIRDEDILAFKALDQAYNLNRQSLCFIVNDLPAIRNKHYEGATTLRLSNLLSIPEESIKVSFVDRIIHNDVADYKRSNFIVII